MVGAVLKGAGLNALLSSAAFTIVIVGTIAAICVQTPLSVMRHALRIFPWVMKPPPLRLTDETLEQAVAAMQAQGSRIGYVVGDKGYRGVVTRDALDAAIASHHARRV